MPMFLLMYDVSVVSFCEVKLGSEIHEESDDEVNGVRVNDKIPSVEMGQIRQSGEFLLKKFSTVMCTRAIINGQLTCSCLGVSCRPAWE